MNRLIKIVLLVLPFLMANNSFARQTIHFNSTHSSIISSPANNLVSEKCPIPPATSLQAYRFRHGIDRGNVTVSKPIEMNGLPGKTVIDIHETIAVSTDYFFSHTSLLPPPPDFIGCFSLRSPPFSC